MCGTGERQLAEKLTQAGSPRRHSLRRGDAPRGRPLTLDYHLSLETDALCCAAILTMTDAKGDFLSCIVIARTSTTLTVRGATWWQRDGDFSFVSALSTDLNGTTAVIEVAAGGEYDNAKHTFTASRIVVLPRQPGGIGAN